VGPPEGVVLDRCGARFCLTDRFGLFSQSGSRVLQPEIKGSMATHTPNKRSVRQSLAVVGQVLVVVVYEREVHAAVVVDVPY
jgi:hypothetical protein